MRPPLLDDADSVHAEVAREMVAGHDWITLHANGIRYLEKAPLLYWSMAASFSVFGPQDWAARLPLAIYALALFVTVYLGGPRFFNSAIAGFYAALILIAFTIAASLMFHNFWASPAAQVTAQTINFCKNLGLIGLFAMIATFGPGSYSIEKK